MELSLKNDYDSITEATKNMVMELQCGIKDFDETEKKVCLGLFACCCCFFVVFCCVFFCVGSLQHRKLL